MKNVVQCKQCGINFKQRFGREKYCSRDCYHESRVLPPITLTCKECGKEEKISRSGSRRNNIFCSSKCAGAYIRRVKWGKED